MAVGDQALNDGDDVVDMVGGLWLDGRFGQSQPAHILVKGGNVTVGDGAVIGPFLVGAVDDLVVDVGVVADKGHVIAGILQVAIDHIEDDAGPGMADVAVIVDRHAADIHACLARHLRDKGLFLAGEGIVKT